LVLGLAACLDLLSGPLVVAASRGSGELDGADSVEAIGGADYHERQMQHVLDAALQRKNFFGLFGGDKKKDESQEQPSWQRSGAEERSENPQASGLAKDVADAEQKDVRAGRSATGSEQAGGEQARQEPSERVDPRGEQHGKEPQEEGDLEKEPDACTSLHSKKSSWWKKAFGKRNSLQMAIDDAVKLCKDHKDMRDAARKVKKDIRENGDELQKLEKQKAEEESTLEYHLESLKDNEATLEGLFAKLEAH